MKQKSLLSANLFLLLLISNKKKPNYVIITVNGCATNVITADEKEYNAKRWGIGYEKRKENVVKEK